MSAISQAIRELEKERERVEGALRTLRGLAAVGGASRSRNISPEGRRRIAEAQRRRWARARAGKKGK